MALSLKKQTMAARKRYDQTVDAIYACATNNTTPFSECEKLASPELRGSLDSQRQTLMEIECSAVSAGKAYRDTFGGLTWYR